MEFWIPVAISIIMGTLCAILAISRERSAIVWFFVGAFLGWIGLLLIFILPPLNKELVSKPMPDVVEPSVEEKKEPESSLEKTDNWFYLDQKKEVCGPFSVQMIKEKWNKGDLSENSWVWNEMIIEWKKISQVEELWKWLQTITTCKA
jgi:hypothetical protein